MQIVFRKQQLILGPNTRRFGTHNPMQNCSNPFPLELKRASRAHNGSLLLALWCSGNNENTVRAYVAAIKTWKVVYSSVQVAI